jgi:hypothetical protein
VIQAVVGREGDGFFASWDAGVPVVELKMGAAEQVVGFRGGSSAEWLLENLQGLIDSASGEKGFRRFGRWRIGDETEERQEHDDEPSLGRSSKSRFPSASLSASLTGLVARFGMTKFIVRMTKVIRTTQVLVRMIVMNPRHGLGDHFYAGAVDQGLVGIGRR